MNSLTSQLRTDTVFSKWRSLEKWLPFAPVWFAPWILLSPVYLTGKALYWGTPFLQFAPWREWAWQMFFLGKIPLWNPLVGMGAPLIANYQSALFYPPNWLLALLQAADGVSGLAWGQAVLVALHLSWAGTGMILLTRRLGLSSTAQGVAGLAFSLSSYLVSRSGFSSINATAAWMPWVIWSVDRLTDTNVLVRDFLSWKFVSAWLPLTLCMGMQLLAGHAQVTWYTLLFAIVWLLFWSLNKRGAEKILKAGLLFVTGAFFAVLLAGVQLLPTAEYLLNSQRSAAVAYDYAVNYSFWPWRLLSLLAPDLFGNPAHGDYWFNVFFWEDAIYIGLLPVLLAFAAIISAIFKKNSVGNETQPRYQNQAFIATLTAVSVVAMVFALGYYTPIFPFFYRYIPTFAMFQAPTRFSIMAVFSLALLGGIGVQSWHRPVKRGLYWSRLGAAGAFAVTLGAGLGWYAMRADVKLTFIRAVALAGFWALGTGILNLSAPKSGTRSISRLWSLAVMGWVCLDLLAAGWGLNPGGPIALYSQGADTASEARTAAGPARIFLPAGVEYELKFNRFLRVGTFQFDEDIFHLRQVLLPDANMFDRIPSANNFDPLVPNRYSRWMDHLGTRSTDELRWWYSWMDVGGIEAIDPQAPSGIRIDPVPGAKRFRWFPCAISASNGDDAWEKVNRQQNREHFGPGQTEPLVLEMPESDLSSNDCAEDSQPVIDVLVDEPNRVVLDVTSSKAGWLFQADTWYPGWQASLDSRPTAIVKAEYLFRAVSIPSGKHTVEIVYRPASFYLGGLLTLLSLAGLGAFFIKVGWRTRAE